MAVDEARAALVELKAADLASASLGESEAELRRAFDKAYTVPYHQTSVIFIDEIDTICPHRSHASVHEARLVAQLLTLLDGSDVTRSTVRCASACHIVGDGVRFCKTLRRPFWRAGSSTDVGSYSFERASMWLRAFLTFLKATLPQTDCCN